MEIETVRDYDYENFLDGYTMPGEQDLDLMERDEKEVPDQVRRDNRILWLGGLLSLIGGAGLVVLSNVDLGLSGLIPAFLVTGIVGLGLGLSKAFGKIFRKKTLSLPRLQIRRKTERSSRSSFGGFDSQQRSLKLAKSETDKVFMGVCGGIAAHSGISSALIRMLFIVAFAISGGTVALLYFALGLFLPNSYNTGPRS